MSLTVLSEINDPFYAMIFKITLDDDLDVVVIRGISDTIVDSSQSKAHIINVEITITGILAIYDLDGRSLLTVASAVDDKEIPIREDKLIKYSKSPLIV